MSHNLRRLTRTTITKINNGNFVDSSSSSIQHHPDVAMLRPPFENKIITAVKAACISWKRRKSTIFVSICISACKWKLRLIAVITCLTTSDIRLTLPTTTGHTISPRAATTTSTDIVAAVQQTTTEYTKQPSIEVAPISLVQTRWLYCVEWTQYSIRLEVVRYV